MTFDCCLPGRLDSRNQEGKGPSENLGQGAPNAVKRRGNRQQGNSVKVNRDLRTRRAPSTVSQSLKVTAEANQLRAHGSILIKSWREVSEHQGPVGKLKKKPVVRHRGGKYQIPEPRTSKKDS